MDVEESFRSQIKTTTADHEANSVTLVLKEAPEYLIEAVVSKFPTDHGSDGNFICTVKVLHSKGEGSPKRLKQIEDWYLKNKPLLMNYLYWVAKSTVKPIVRT